MKTTIQEWGWFGFGYVGSGAQGNMFPALCLGVVRLSWVKGTLADAIKKAVLS